MKTLLHRLLGPRGNACCLDPGLLLLRLWLGLTMLLNHGLAKLMNFSQTAAKFPDLFGFGSAFTLGLGVFAELCCSALLVLGLLTRFAALMLALTMATAFFLVHKMVLSGEQSGELAFIYLAGFVALVVIGPGRYSVDACLFKETQGATEPTMQSNPRSS